MNKSTRLLADQLREHLPAAVLGKLSRHLILAQSQPDALADLIAAGHNAGLSENDRQEADFERLLIEDQEDTAAQVQRLPKVQQHQGDGEQDMNWLKDA
jgi:hypothetical protein